MTKFLFILNELWRNIFKNPGSTFGALLVMTLLFLLFDLFWIAAETSDQFYKSYLSEVQMEVFITEEASDSTIAGIRENLVNRDGITSLVYLSKEKARAELTKLVGLDLLVGYDSTNPLPQSYILSLNQDFVSQESLATLETEINQVPGVSYVFYNKDWLAKAEKTKGIIANIGLFLGGLILLTVLLSSANNMRLTARARVVGFSQIRLLGAGKLLLATPFLIEGVVLGALSAGIGWGIISYFKDKIEFTQITIVFPPLEQLLLYCAGAGLLGLLSGYFGIRKLLKL